MGLLAGYCVVAILYYIYRHSDTIKVQMY